MKKPRLARVISIECFTPRAHASVQFPSFAEVTVRFFDLVLHPHIRHAFPRLRTVVAAGPPLEANYSRAREYASTEPFAATDSKLTFATLQRPPGCYPATTETGHFLPSLSSCTSDCSRFVSSISGVDEQITAYGTPGLADQDSRDTPETQ